MYFIVFFYIIFYMYFIYNPYKRCIDMDDKSMKVRYVDMDINV